MIKVETIDPFADVRYQENVFVATQPRTRATISLTPSAAMSSGWQLFWRSLWAVIRRRESVDFWMEGRS